MSGTSKRSGSPHTSAHSSWRSNGCDCSFRLDLFYRLNGVNVRVPALHDRRDDIIELAQHFLEQHRGARRLELSSAAIQANIEAPRLS
jgi:DNA-binding NtrC family response regulator